MRAGAVDFVVKPVGAERLHVSLRNALNASALEGELQRMKKSRSGTLGFADIITKTAPMQAVIRVAEKAAASAIPVLIGGESGVGKELIARAIHGSGARRSKPFVAVNCGAIPDHLVESILFGHEAGAFTGATGRHIGKFVEASGGTLFLDEVTELPLGSQVKLLRAIQEGEVDTVGGRKPVKVDVRLVSASNRNLMAAVNEGRFREDLFYRLSVLPIAVPPLRERAEDIPDLVRHFLARFAAEEGKRVRVVTAEAMSLLAAHPWPGNVRQLENAIFRAVVLAETDAIGIDEFPQIAAPAARRKATASGLHFATIDVAGSTAAEPEPISLPASEAPALDADPSIMPDPLVITADQGAPHTGTSVAIVDGAGDVRPLDAIEADLIRFAIARYHGQMSEVARRLQIGRSTLYRRLRELGLDPDETRGPLSDGVAQG